MDERAIVTLRDEIAAKHGEEAAQEAITLLLEVLHDPRGWTFHMADTVAGREKHGRGGRRSGREHIPLEEDEEGESFIPSVPPDQIARLEAQEDIQLAPPALVDEVLGKRELTRWGRHKLRKKFKRRLARRGE